MRARLAAIPAVVLGAGVSPWWTCGLFKLPHDDATQMIGSGTGKAGGSQAIGTPTNPPTSPPYQLGHREEVSPPEQRRPNIVPEIPPLRIPEASLVHVLDLAQPAFLGCFHRAQRNDPTLISAKINLHLFVDTSGAVMSVSTDVTDPKLATCLTNNARRLKFPPPSALAVADMTFFAW
jgi:hypothetical protein